MINERILLPELRDKVMNAQEAAALLKEGMVIGCSGFTTAGFPKAVPQAVAQQGTAKNLTLITPASTGAELDGALAKAGLISKRYSFQSNADMRKAINKGEIGFMDIHLGQVPKYIESGFLGSIDIAIIECAMVLEDCGIVPTTSLGAANSLVKNADRVILEINTTCPPEVYGLHDIYEVCYGKEIPVYAPGDRIGTASIPCTPEKIAAIVFSDEIGSTPVFKAPDEVSGAIAANIIQFLKIEITEGRLPKELAPLQSGVGAVGNAVFAGLKTAGFSNLTMYTEVVQDSSLDLIKEGVIDMASTTSLSLSEAGLKELYEHLNYYKEHIVIRPQDISNHPEPIRRLGVIAINTAAEIDIYGNVNSTHATGSSIINGIGGSGDFSRNARVSIFMTPSTGKSGALSRIVPMVTHVDNCEHDVNIVVTEYGIADLRGKCPKERVEVIIENCAHPDYRPQLRAYYEKACKNASGMQTPHDLASCFDMHRRYMETGSMKI